MILVFQGGVIGVYKKSTRFYGIIWYNWNSGVKNGVVWVWFIMAKFGVVMAFLG